MDRIIYAGSVTSGGGSVNGKGEGIYTVIFSEDGSLSLKNSLYSVNAGIITKYGNKYIYAANEAKDFGGINGSGGGVSAYRIKEDGNLAFINSSISYGSRTAYVSVSEKGRYLLAVNHGSHTTVTCSYAQNENGEWVLKRGFDDSSAAVFALREDGGIGELTDLKIFRGCGYWCHGGGQSTAHLHCIKIKKNLVVACNRGCDEIEVMRLDEATGKLEILSQFETRPAYAPRHAEFHPSINVLYAVNENYPSVSAYAYDPDSGEMKELQTIGSMKDEYYQAKPLPSFTKRHADPDEKNTCGFADRSATMPSDVHISKDGKHLYMSNRQFAGTGSLAVFDIDEKGMLEKTAVIELDGKDPRGFGLSDDGKYLLVSLLDQNRLDLYEIDAAGIPSDKISSLQLNAPSSVIF